MNFDWLRSPNMPDWVATLPGLSFLWQDMLWLLLVLPLAVAAYFMMLARKKRAAMRYNNLSMVKAATSERGTWRRHVPPVLYLIGLTLTILAIARPAALIAIASNKATIILAMDVSGSMRADDVKPSRLKAAQDAAKAFIQEQPKETQIGIVAFASTALVVQNPTNDKQALIKAIDRFELQRGTAIGSAILMSLSTLFPDEEFNISGRQQQAQQQPGQPLRDPYGNPYSAQVQAAQPEKKKPDPVEPGSLKTAILILLTDGANTAGPEPVEAAKQAADHGLRVYTVGFGTKEGAIVGFAGRNMRAELVDEDVKEIADMTRGQYFQAGSAEELKAVYQQLAKQRMVEVKETEITAFFAAAAACFTLLSAALSLLWFNRIF